MLLHASVETDVGKNYLVKKVESGSPQVTWADDGVEGKVCLVENAKGVSQSSPRETARTSTFISGYFGVALVIYLLTDLVGNICSVFLVLHVPV